MKQFLRKLILYLQIMFQSGDFGTVIVHDRDGIGKASSLAEYSTFKKLPVPGQVESHGEGRKLADFRYLYLNN